MNPVRFASEQKKDSISPDFTNHIKDHMEDHMEEDIIRIFRKCIHREYMITMIIRNKLIYQFFPNGICLRN